ncbi:MAG: glutamate-cysteine ligase family protein, partial [Aeromicrobium sp.]
MTCRTVGVEEEMFLVDPSTGRLDGSSDRVIGAVGAQDRIGQELFLQQVETRTEPHRDMAALLEDLRATR